MLTNTPTSERIHIGIFGKVNSGKSSIFNAITNQKTSIVSEVAGTTTDAVKKTMELIPLGPIIIFDTAGFEDSTILGKNRYEKTLEVLNKTDIALLVTDSTNDLSTDEIMFLNKIKEKNIPYFIVINKIDKNKNADYKKIKETYKNVIQVSVKENINIDTLKDKLSNLQINKDKSIIKDKVNQGDTVILVTPIDESAPKGRLILPQQLVLRELLDNNCIVICTQPQELSNILNNLKNKPRIIITDSQAFGKIKDIVPNDIYLTSFSILFARYKGDLDNYINSVKKLDTLKDNDKILISEGCTHHIQCNDIGRYKIPKMINNYANKKLEYNFTQGNEFPRDLSEYKLIIHCGACMLNESEMKSRINLAKAQAKPIINYGILISYMNGILKRATEIFDITI